MTIPVDEQPLLIATFDPFRNHQSHTLRSLAEQLNVSEPVAEAALERLERVNVLVRTRGGTDAPVWKRHPEADTNPLVCDESD